MGFFWSGVGGHLAAHEGEESLFPRYKPDVLFPECLGVDVAISYKFRGLKVVQRLAKKLERVHHAAKGGGGEVREVVLEPFHHLLVEPGVGEFSGKVQSALLGKEV
jgi:hypothetical protein